MAPDTVYSCCMFVDFEGAGVFTTDIMEFETGDSTSLPQLTEISIKNNISTRTLNYGDGLKLTAQASNLPEGAKIVWFVNDEEKGTGEVFIFSNATVDATITIKIVDKNGNILKDSNGGEISESEKITVKAGFFQKLISFFKNLFKANRIVVQ